MHKIQEAWIWLGDVYTEIQTLASYYLNLAEQETYLLPGQAEILMYCIVIGCLLFVMCLWQKLFRIRRFLVALTGLSLVSLTVILALIPRAYTGLIDDNCPKYNAGALVFHYISSSIVPVDPYKPYEKSWLVIIVRAPDRWGTELHICRVPYESEEARLVIKQIKRAGAVTFFFNPRFVEIPEILFEPDWPEPLKDVPPEVLLQEENN